MAARLKEHIPSFSCENCFADVELYKNTYAAEIVEPYTNRDLRFSFDQVDVEGDPFSSTLFFHEDCFDQALAELRETVGDNLPIEEVTGALYCDTCGSSIRMRERTMRVVAGEMVPSVRLQQVEQFSVDDEASVLLVCMPCAATLMDLMEIEDWTELTQNGECRLCTKGRCWRVGRCLCSCHVEEGKDNG